MVLTRSDYRYWLQNFNNITVTFDLDKDYGTKIKHMTSCLKDERNAHERIRAERGKLHKKCSDLEKLVRKYKFYCDTS